jgi:uncharacterized protein
MGLVKPIFTVAAAELDAGGKEYVRPIPNAWLSAAFEDEAKPLGDGALDLRLSKSGSDVIVHGKLKAAVEVPCARCLEPVTVTLAPEITVMFVPEQKMRRRQSKDEEITGNDADVLSFDGDNVVLDDVVRDDLLLEIPMIPLCSEACKGIASTRETSEAKGIDPRLAPLLALKKQKE